MFIKTKKLYKICMIIAAVTTACSLFDLLVKSFMPLWLQFPFFALNVVVAVMLGAIPIAFKIMGLLWKMLAHSLILVLIVIFLEIPLAAILLLCFLTFPLVYGVIAFFMYYNNLTDDAPVSEQE